jgi:Ca2+-binding RTX toxin-like protein
MKVREKIVYAPDASTKLQDFDPGNFVLEHATRKSVEFSDEDHNYQIVITGTGLHTGDGVITSGEMTGLKFEADGKALVTVSNVSFDAAKITHASLHDFILTLNQKILNLSGDLIGSNGSDHIFGGNGADLLLGKNGDDFLEGGKGNDVLTGGSGSDVFTFMQGYCKDVVTDFDAIGGIGNQDFIGASFDEVSVKKDGHNTIIDFGGGDTLTLLGIDHRDVNQSDFYQPE